MPNIVKLQTHAENMIRRWSKSQKGKVMRDGAQRAVPYMARTSYTPRERALTIEGAERIAISAVGLSSLDFELDTIVFGGQLYKLPVPPVGPRPDGTAVFYDCQVIRIGAAT